MKTKKLSLPPRKVSNVLFYQKMDFAKKQTKNQKKWRKAKGKFYSSELGRSIPMIRILKTFSNKWIENLPSSHNVGIGEKAEELQKVANLRKKRWWF